MSGSKLFEHVKSLLPGLLLTFGIAFLAILLSEASSLFGNDKFSAGISAISVSLFIGAAVSQIFPVSKKFNAGIDFTFKNLLRFGTILLGLRLNLNETYQIGAAAIYYILAVIAFVFCVGYFIGSYFKLPRTIRYLISAGTAICGISAVLAVSDTIKAKKEETAIAVAVVSIFGFLAFLSYPFLADYLLKSNFRAVGIFLGTSIHDTAQVIGSSIMYEQLFQTTGVVDIAIVVKLIRNLFIIVLVPLLAMISNNQQKEKKSVFKSIPVFIYLFLVCVVIRSAGDYNQDLAFNFINQFYWQKFLDKSDVLATFIFTASTAAIGLSLNVKLMTKENVKAFLLGLVVAASSGLFMATILKTFFMR